MCARGLVRNPPFGALLFQKLLAKDLPRSLSIMAPAEQANVVRRRRPAERKRMAMLEREIAPRAAAPSLRVDEGLSETRSLSKPSSTIDMA